MTRKATTMVERLGPKAQAQIAHILSQAELRKAVPTAKLTKYRNVATIYKSVQGFERRYDSKKEAEQAAKFDNLLKIGMIAWWLPQISVPLPGGVIYRADFLVCWTKTGLQWFDVKGRDTQASINKRKQVKALYGISVEIV